MAGYTFDGDANDAAFWYPFAVNQQRILTKLGMPSRVLMPVDGVLIRITFQHIHIAVGKVSGFLFYPRDVHGAYIVNPTTGRQRRDILRTSSAGFGQIVKDVSYKAGLSYWTDNKDNLVSWNAYLHDGNVFNDTAASYEVLGKSPYTDDEVYINGVSLGTRPFPDELRNGGIYYAKVGKYLVGIHYGLRTANQFFPEGIFSAFLVVYDMQYGGITKMFIGYLSFKRVQINAAGTKMVCIAKTVPRQAPTPIGTDLPESLPITTVAAGEYTITPPFSYPKTQNAVYTNYWEDVIEYDIVLTSDETDPIHLVENNRSSQYAVLAGMKRDMSLTVGDPAYYALLNKFENTTIVTDIWFDVDTQEVKKETLTDISVSLWTAFSFTINNPNLTTPLHQTVGTTSAGYSLWRNNPYVKNTVVTACTATSSTLNATRYDTQNKLSFSSTPSKPYTQTPITGWLFPFMYSWNGINYDTSIGLSEYSFPYGTIFEKNGWQQVVSDVHFNRFLWQHDNEHIDTSGVLSDRHGNVLYFYGEDGYILRNYKSEHQKFKAFKKGHIVELEAKQIEIANAIKYSEDIIGVI